MEKVRIVELCTTWGSETLSPYKPHGIHLLEGSGNIARLKVVEISGASPTPRQHQY